MRKIKLLLAVCVVLLTGVSCETEKKEKVVLALEKTILDFEASVNAPQTIKVNAVNVDWSVVVSSKDKSWLEAVKDDGNLLVSVTDNTLADKRYGVIKIIPNSDEVPVIEVNVTQKGSSDQITPEIVIEPTSLNFVSTDAPVQEVTVSIRGEGFTWEASVEDAAKDWLTIDANETKIVVTVSNNLDAKARSGKITLIPTEPKVASKTILVTQEGKLQIATLKVENTTELNFGARDKESQKVIVTAENCTWTYATRDENDKGIDWINCTKQKDGILVSLSSNTGQERKGYIIISTNTEGVPVVKVTVTQAQGAATLSTLTHDVEFTANQYKATLFATQKWNDKATSTSWNFNFYDEGVKFEKGQSFPLKPKPDLYAGNGNRLYLELSSPVVKINDDLIYNLPYEQEYTVNIKSSYNQPDYPYTFISGREFYYVASRSTLTPFGSWYYTIENDIEVAAAPIVGGTIKITKNGDNYDFTMNLLDDKDNKIVMHYTGSIEPLQTNGEMDKPIDYDKPTKPTTPEEPNKPVEPTDPNNPTPYRR